MYILNWNVNGLRSRIDQLTRIIIEHDPDIITLQEIKCDIESGKEVLDKLHSLGYMNNISSNFPDSSRHGVLTIVKTGLYFDENSISIEQGRILKTTVDGFSIYNCYINQGRELYCHEYYIKLNLLQKLLNEINTERYVLIGDFNVMPKDEDVWSITHWNENVVGRSTLEIDAFNRLLSTGAINLPISISPKMTWYDYKNTWRKYNDEKLSDTTNKYGVKCDHVIVKGMEGDLELLVHERLPYYKAEIPTSDHVPMIINLDQLNEY